MLNQKNKVMIKKISTYAIVILAFALGSLLMQFELERKYSNVEKRYAIADSIIKCADNVIEENNLYDTCGSDNMSQYLNYHAKLDSLNLIK